ncbi:MAG: periplasmic heavy metal sensor [bacterium]
MMKPTLLAAALLLALSTPAAARPPMGMGGPGGPGGPGRMGPPDFLQSLIRPETVMRHQNEVALTDEQRRTIQKTMSQTRDEIEVVRWDMQAQSTEVETLLQSTPIDRDAALAATGKLFELEGRLKTSNLTLLIEITNTLTPEQVETLRALQKDERPGRHGRRSMRGSHDGRQYPDAQDNGFGSPLGGLGR